MFGRGPLKEHFYKSFICNEIAVNDNFHFSPLYVDGKFLSDWDKKKKKKNNLFPLVLYVKCAKNRFNGFRGDVVWNCWRMDADERTTNAWLYYKLTYEPSAQVG